MKKTIYFFLLLTPSIFYAQFGPEIIVTTDIDGDGDIDIFYLAIGFEDKIT